MSKFKIGDLVKNKYNSSFYPPCEIIELTENGFKYRMTEQYNLGARLGFIPKDSIGESFVLDGWEKIIIK